MDVNEKPIIASTGTGLGNRLLCIISLWRICEKINRPFGVYWPRNWHNCFCHFKSLFKTEVNLYKTKPSGMIEIHPKWRSDNRTETFHPPNRSCLVNFANLLKLPNDEEKINWHPYAQRIKLNNLIQKKVNSFLRRHDFSNTLGVHIRLGDVVRNRNGANEAIKQIVKTVKYLLSENDKLNFFISSDNLETEKKVADVIGKQAFYFPKRLDPSVRSGSGREAIADLFLLSKTKGILATTGTYSRFASVWGDIPRFDTLNSNFNPYYRTLSHRKALNKPVTIVGNLVLKHLEKIA